jgi:5-methylcytosine-specific restriction endonuclease McrA
VYTGKRSIVSIQVEHPNAVAGRMDVDHRIPIIEIQESGKEKDWNSIIYRMFCEEDNLQSICSKCHLEKTKKERTERALARKNDTKR